MKLNRVSLATLFLAAVGCQVVKKVEPVQYIPAHNPEVVWVTYTDNSFVPVSSPKIVGDSLQGTWQGLAEPVSISLNEIQSVQAKMPSPKRTALLATVLTVTVGGALYSIATAGTSGSASSCIQVEKGTPTGYCCPIMAGEKHVTC